MSHKIIIIQPPGGGNRMAAPTEVNVTVEYSPAHGLTPQQAHRNIERIEAMSARFYERLMERLAAPDDGE